MFVVKIYNPVSEAIKQNIIPSQQMSNKKIKVGNAQKNGTIKIKWFDTFNINTVYFVFLEQRQTCDFLCRW